MSSSIRALKVVMVTAEVGAMSAVPNLGDAMMRKLPAGALPSAGAASVAPPAGGTVTSPADVGCPGVTVWVMTTGSLDAQAAAARTADIAPTRPKNFRRSTVLSRSQRDTDTLTAPLPRPRGSPCRAPDGSVFVVHGNRRWCGRPLPIAVPLATGRHPSGYGTASAVATG